MSDCNDDVTSETSWSISDIIRKSAQFYDAHDALEADGVYATAVQKVQSQRLETEHRQDNVPGTTTTTTVPQGDVKGEKHEDQHDTQSLTIKERIMNISK
ncbi:hypothetical protein FOB64_006528 [Candida albicans]|uniref:Uncharacterized protein n=1 Tax=Candida albicans TaxID=5476 RepID=A0A8H6BTA4_CANAX|nr:hypothetical protein FOB64_006528 [Candida albicans]